MLEFKSVAVIGRGPSALGRWWGDKIDKFDCVIRNWDHFGKGYTKHNLGEKYDIAFYQVSPKYIQKLVTSTPKRQPAIGWLGSYLKGTPTAYSNEIDSIDQTDWVKQAKKMGGKSEQPPRLLLTKGTVAACWAISKTKPKGRVMLVGFDIVRAGYAVGGRYGPDKLYRWRRHDFSIERKLLEHYAAEANVKLQFAQDVWK